MQVKPSPCPDCGQYSALVCGCCHKCPQCCGWARSAVADAWWRDPTLYTAAELGLDPEEEADRCQT